MDLRVREFVENFADEIIGIGQCAIRFRVGYQMYTVIWLQNNVAAVRLNSNTLFIDKDERVYAFVQCIFNIN